MVWVKKRKSEGSSILVPLSQWPRSVFISYRRQLSWQLAQLVRNNLAGHDFDTFIDHKNLDSGEFASTILRQIEARRHFIVVLEPGSLDRISQDGDWLRCEIAHALAHRRNVVPVTANGFEFRRDLVLPPDVTKLPSLNAVSIAEEYFDEAMERLRTRFLNTQPPSTRFLNTRPLGTRFPNTPRTRWLPPTCGRAQACPLLAR